MTDSDGILAGPTERMDPAGCIGRGLWVGVCSSTPSTPQSIMARKRRNFKLVSNVHTETIANNDWSSFLKIEKANDSLVSAWVDKVRISFIASEEEAEVNTGLLFVASMDPELNSSTPSENDGQVISASASSRGSGVVTLDIKRRIEENGTPTSVHPSRTGLPIFLHVRSANLGEQTGAYLVVETWGRWHKCESL